MKYKDYYAALGVEPGATEDEIKQAYRKMAHKFHPDVSKDPKGEEKFKECAEAYATLKDPEKRREYDGLGRRRNGEEFVPPRDWQQRHGGGAASFDDVDLSDLFASMQGGRGARGRPRQNAPVAGRNFEVTTPVTLEQLFSGEQIDVRVELPEYDEHGLPHRVAHAFMVSVPRGAKQGQRLRLAGKGGPGQHGGRTGDLFVVLHIVPHPLYRADGADLYLDLPLTPAEAALGVVVPFPTLAGTVELRVPAGSSSAKRMRLSGRGLPAAGNTMGDLYAVIQIVVPKALSAREQLLYEELATLKTPDPRAHFQLQTSGNQV